MRKEIWNDARKKLSEEKKLIKAGKADPQNSAETEQLVKSIKSSKYPLLMNLEHLSEEYSAKLYMILLHNRRFATAYRLKEELRLIFKLPSEEVSAAIDKWRCRAWLCQIPKFVEFQRKIKRHKKAIIAAITLGLSNARIEATNNKIKLSIRMAYGFRNLDNLKAMIMLRRGGLVVSLPRRAT